MLFSGLKADIWESKYERRARRSFVGILLGSLGILWSLLFPAPAPAFWVGITVVLISTVVFFCQLEWNG